jgi:hypothetical protein
MSRGSRTVSSLLVSIAVTSALALPAYAQDSDTTAPVLVSFDFNPKSINVLSSTQDVSATFRVTDDLSGVASVFVRFIPPTSAVSRASGTSRISSDGTYQTVTPFPQFVESGTWTVEVSLRDVVGNQAILSSATVGAAGFPNELFIVSNSDLSPPTVGSIAVTPNAVDVSSGDATVTIQLQASDDVSGVVLGSVSAAFSAVELVSPTAIQSSRLSSLDLSLVSGTINNGTWSATARLPRYGEPGTWRIGRISLADRAGNITDLRNDQLRALGLDTPVEVASSPADVTPPTLDRITFNPNIIDTSSSAQSVVVTLSINDDLSGVDFTPDLFGGFTTGALLFSPSAGQQTSVPEFNTLPQLVSGNELNGVWQTTIVLPQFSEAGTWRVLRLDLQDNAANDVTLQRRHIEGTGLVDDLIVIRPSLADDGMVGVGGGWVEDTTFGARASLFVPAGILAELTSVAIDVFANQINIPLPQGFSAPGTRFVSIVLNPQPTFPLSAPGLTVVLPLVNAQPAGTPLSLFRLEPSTGQLVPSLDGGGLPIAGTVDPSGLSATFTGVVHLSTVVGLLAGSGTDTIPPTIVCAPADPVWHSGNVTRACTASDVDSGLADPADASFFLATNVADGDEQLNAFTNTRQVCDVAGNCVTVGPIGGNMVDRKAPHVTPPAIQTIVQTQPGGAVVSYASPGISEGGSGLGSLGCVPTSGLLFPVGATVVTCTAVDRVGNTGVATFVVTVTAAAVDGKMHGTGHLADGKTHHHFAFRVTAFGDREHARLEYWVREPQFCSSDDHDGTRHGADDRDYGRARNKVSYFQATAIASVLFSNDPSFGPSRGTRPGPAADTVAFSGTGKWNGKPGYTFQATASDRGEPGRGRDTFSLLVRDAAGNVVVNVADTLDGGNVQSMR